MSREDRGEDVFYDDVDLLVILPGNTTLQAQDESRAYRCLRGVPASKDILLKSRAQVERYFERRLFSNRR
jgi:hypothetical protein